MQKSKIEWTDYTLNPIKGLCPMACSYCYARAMYKRFHWNPEIRFADPFYEFYKLDNKPPSRVFIGSTMELFGEWIRPEWLHRILAFCTFYPQHTFIFLTKKPENLIKWSPYPKNCWVGITATNAEEAYESYLASVKATVKFVSFEPLLGAPDGNYGQLAEVMEQVHLVIVGQQTPVRKATMPSVGWVEQIVRAADKAGVKVFLKDNLITCVDQYEFALKDGKYRQEMPELELR